jgi:hypothetical protein
LNKTIPKYVFLVIPLLAIFVFTIAGSLGNSRLAIGMVEADQGRTAQTQQDSGKSGSGPVSVSNQGKVKGMGEHYLLLVSSIDATTLTTENIKQLDQSAYDGAAVSFQLPYDVSPVTSSARMDANIADWKKSTRKDFWPWVFINRLVGIDRSATNPYSKNPYFENIPGADLDDEAGAQKDFIQYLENAVRTAKLSGAPGVVVDLEFYNYHKEYDLTLLAKEAGKTPAEVITLLRRLGAKMADAAAAEYPSATLWFLFTDLGDTGFKVYGNQSYYPSPAYITMGLLEEIAKEHFQLKVVSGGEVGLGYCHTSLSQFERVINNRAAGFSPWLQKYPDILELGGTLTLWSDRSGKSGWMKEGYCGASSASTAEDLQPYLELLFRTYRYNWIYASGAGSYYAFQRQSAPRFDAVIKEARTRALAVAAH